MPSVPPIGKAFISNTTGEPVVFVKEKPVAPAPLPTGSKALDVNPWPKSLQAIPDLNERYLRPESRRKTVAVLGASTSKPEISSFEPLAAKLAQAIISEGGNIVTGAGNAGIMGASFEAAKKAATQRGAGENLTLIKTPLWGDEDLDGGRAIGVASSETRRVEKFAQVANTIAVFPGGAGTSLELAQLVFMMAYPPKGRPAPERVVLVGSSYWSGFLKQVGEQTRSGQLNPRVLDQITVVDDEQSLLEATAVH